MKILYLTDYGQFKGGASISLLLLAEEMEKSGNDVYVLSPVCDHKPLIDNVSFSCVPGIRREFPFIFRNPISAIKLVRIMHDCVQSIDPDVIHAHFPRAARAIGCGRIIGWYKDKSIVYTERELVSGLRTIYKVLYSHLVARPFDAIVCLSEKATSYWRKYREDGIFVIPNSGGEVFDAFSEKRQVEVMSLYEHNPDRVGVLFAGRFDPIKRWDLALDIIKLLAAEKDKFDVYVAISNGNDEEKYAEFIDDLKKNHVYVYENANLDTMSDLYYLSDIHVVTSRMESFGRTAIEAMSRKAIVLSTDAGAIGEVIGDRKYIIDPDAKMFADRIKWYAGHRNELEQEQEAAFNRYTSNFTTLVNTNRHLELYRSLLQKQDKS